MGPSSFLEASKMGDLARVQELVGQCTDFNRGEALLRAALGGRLPVVRFLVEECAVDVEFTTENGVTALMWAASSGNVEVVRYLAEQEGANVNATSQNGYTAFVVAAGFGYTEVVHYLAKECGADVHARDEDGSTALLLTAANGHIDTARYLVEHCGLAVDGKNTNGYTALMGAARENHLNLVQYLAGQCGAHVDASNGGGSTALMEAAAHGSVEVVRYLAGQCNADVDARNDVGASALMWAAATGELQVVRCLAQECGADVNAKTKDGNTALVVAGQNDRIDIVRCLVEQCGADLSVQNNEGMSALNLAAQRGKLELVRYLVEYSGEDTNVKDEALMWSARSGSIDVVQHLIEHCGADVRSEDGARAVIFAASHGNIEVMRYLVDQCGADVNAKDKFGGSTALMWAADNGMMQAVQYLVEQGSVDVNTRSEMGITALMRAAASGNIQVVRYLVEHCGADAEAKTNTGDTALMWAAEDGRNDVVRYLFENCGVDVNVQNENGDTALMRAAANGKIRVVRYLAAHCGAGVNDRNEEGDTALMKAAAKGNTEMVRYLAEECGADVSIKNEKGNTALISAVEYEHIEVARFLAEQCPADVNASNEYGITALMWAARHGYCDLVQYFVEECEAQVNVKDGEGKTVLMWAAKSGKVKVVRYFVGQCDAQVNTMSNDGKTALRMAADYGYHEIQRILTPFLLPASHTSDSNETAGTVVTMSSYGIPASEIELTLFNRNGNIGGEFRAKWLDADVVVKLFIPDASHSSFKAEILLWQRLRHPNVIKMYGACEASPHLQFFVCEFASNGSLLDHVKVHPEGKANTWKHLYEAALCLEYLHERGILHGDLRCSNILIGSDGLAKLSNFGLSGPMKRPSSGTPALIGSRRWQAPEVLEGEIASYASDVYSLGISILEAVNGTTPWGGGDDSADNWSARFNKKHWTPETDGDSSWYAPDCPAGDARELVWRMCCQDPRKRASLSAVVRELERLAITESSEHSQPEHDPADMVHEYESGKVAGLWLKLVERKAKVNDDQYGRVFDDLERIHDCLQESTRNSTLVARFQSLLSEFYETIKMPPKQARMMRLSSTRATATSFYSVQWRIESLMASLGLREFEDSSGREARWQRQQQEDVEYFVSGVSDTFLLLQELKTAEERSAFLRNLQTEMENPEGKYTSDQLEVVRNAYEKIAGGLETDDTSKVTPEWFIPWYELVVDEWNCLGEGGFGSVYRAKWLDSDVVVKRVKLAGSDFKLGASTTIDPSWLTSEDPSDSQAEVDANKRAETVAIFRREVEIWFSLSHPHVVRLFGACHVGRPFFVCEYATHGTLVSFLRKHPGEIWTKLHESALGVQYLHARGVVHGDLKGNNIVIGSDMKAKVTDFGLSSVASGEDKTLVSGAWNWVAPELLDTNKRPTFATDVYSLGMCIVEALRVVEAVEAGKDSSHCLPWRVGDRAAVKYHATHGTVPSRPAICEDSQWELVVRMCVLEADERIKISTVVDELARLAYMSTTTSQAVELAGISISGAVTWESIPEVTAQAQGLLASLQCDDAMISQYTALWERLEQVCEHVDDDESCGNDRCRLAFCSLVAASRESTVKLRERKGGIISVAETTMRCFALQRSLDKFCEAYFLDRGFQR